MTPKNTWSVRDRDIMEQSHVPLTSAELTHEDTK